MSLDQKFLISQLPIRVWFYLFLLIHIVTWTLLPSLVRLNLPLDAIEGALWSLEWQFGYDKNPFLNAWLTAIATKLIHKDWIIYFLSQCSVGLCLWSVWKLANEFLDAKSALVSVLILEFLQYFNLHAIDFNDNTLELGLWAVTIYFFYRATCKQPRPSNWIFTGVFAALSMMAKYYSATLLVAMLLFLLCYKREVFKTFSPYLCLSVFLILILPHIVWLVQHDFVSIYYVIARGSSEPHWSNHLFFPVQFIWQQFEVVLPAFILLILFLVFGNKANHNSEPQQEAPRQLSRVQYGFLYFMALGPLVLTLVLSLLCGTKLRAGWGMPLLSLYGILYLVQLRQQFSAKQLTVFIITIFAGMFLLAVCYSLSILKSTTRTTANFPGQKLAELMTKEWHAKFGTKLSYIAGSRWLGGNISYYSNDRPSVFVEWNTRAAPWINVEDLKLKGGIFIWEISAKENLPKEVQSNFNINKFHEVLLDYRRDSHGKLQKIRVGYTYLPPKNT